VLTARRLYKSFGVKGLSEVLGTWSSDLVTGWKKEAFGLHFGRSAGLDLRYETGAGPHPIVYLVGTLCFLVQE
jgi:hypothetical protein